MTEWEHAGVGITRLVGVASAVVDLVLHVDGLPERGSDLLARASVTEVGGGLTALRAASDAGLPAAYAGGHGHGPFGDCVRGALAAHDVPALLAPTPGQDTGCCVVLVEPGGERTFLTTVGAEGRLSEEALAGVRIGPGDAVYVSGYDLAYPHAQVVAGWVAALPDATAVLLDPGPLVTDVRPDLLEQVLARTTWLSLNSREARLLDASSLLTRLPGLAAVVRRTGAAGAVLSCRGAQPVTVPGVPVPEVVSTNGAGDVHAGSFLAALAQGADPVAAVAAGNAAAARWVGRPLPATMPS